jgi:putative oxidoreductase
MTASAGAVLLVGRVLFAVFFANAAYGHIKKHTMMTGYAKQTGLPVPVVAGWPAGVWLGAAAVSVAVGIWADLGALMIGAFVIPAAWFLPCFLEDRGPDATSDAAAEFLAERRLSRGGTGTVRGGGVDRSRAALRGDRLVVPSLLTAAGHARRR